MERAELKRRAKAQLGGKIFGSVWLYAVLAVLIYNALVRVIGAVPTVGVVISLLLGGPLAYGIDSIFLKQARDGEPMQIGDLFKGFSEDFSGLFLLGLMQTIFIVLWSLLLVVPGIVASLAYSMSYYIKKDHPEYDWRTCMNASKQMMNGHKMELFVLNLSFIGWYIVGAICLGVGSLWVDAYRHAAVAQFYQCLSAQNAAE